MTQETRESINTHKTPVVSYFYDHNHFEMTWHEYCIKNSMKVRHTNSKRFHIPIRMLVLAAAALTLAGCTSPFSPFTSSREGLWGILRITGVSFNNLEGTNLSSGEIAGASGSRSTDASVSASTTFPEVPQTEITHYSVALSNGPGGAPGQTAVVAAGSGGEFAEEVEFSDLVPGEWQVTVEAFIGDPSAGGLLVLRGSAAVTVTMGSVAALAPVVISPVDDPAGSNGSWSLVVTWPRETDPDYPLTDVVTAVEYRINGGSWETAATVEDSSIETDGVTRWVTMGGERAPGSFGVDVRLIAGDKPSPYNVVAQDWERFYVFSNLTSTRTIHLLADDFSYGGGSAITVVLDNPQDLTSFFSGTPESTVVAGTPFTITAVVAGATLWQWRVDGEIQPDATGSSFTMAAPGAGEAGIVRLITLEVTVDGTVYSGNHRVRILPEE